MSRVVDRMDPVRKVEDHMFLVVCPDEHSTMVCFAKSDFFDSAVRFPNLPIRGVC